MAKPAQVPIQFDSTQLTRLRSLSAESGRSLAALVREAVAKFLDPNPSQSISPEALWSILHDPANWQMFKRIAAEMEAQAEPVKPVSVEAASPQPTWRFRRGDDVAGRNNKPPTSPEDDERPPF